MEAPCEQIGFSVLAASSEEPGCPASELEAPSGPSSQGWQSARCVCAFRRQSGAWSSFYAKMQRLKQCHSHIHMQVSLLCFNLRPTEAALQARCIQERPCGNQEPPCADFARWLSVHSIINCLV